MGRFFVLNPQLREPAHVLLCKRFRPGAVGEKDRHDAQTICGQYLSPSLNSVVESPFISVAALFKPGLVFAGAASVTEFLRIACGALAFAAQAAVIQRCQSVGTGLFGFFLFHITLPPGKSRFDQK